MKFAFPGISGIKTNKKIQPQQHRATLPINLIGSKGETHLSSVFTCQDLRLLKLAFKISFFMSKAGLAQGLALFHSQLSQQK